MIRVIYLGNTVVRQIPNLALINRAKRVIDIDIARKIKRKAKQLNLSKEEERKAIKKYIEKKLDKRFLSELKDIVPKRTRKRKKFLRAFRTYLYLEFIEYE